MFATLQAFYTEAPAHWRIMGRIISGFQFHIHTRLHQGCALSVASFNLATNPLIKEIQRRHPNMTVVAYADDLTYMASPLEQLQGAVDLSTKYAAQMGWTINGSKTQFFGWSVDSDAKLQVNGVEVELRPTAFVLGTTIGQVTQAAMTRKQLALEADLLRVQALPLPGSCKQKIIGSIRMPKYNFDLRTSCWTPTIAARLRARILAITWPALTAPCCPLTLMAAAGTAHLADPVISWFWTLRRRWQLWQELNLQIADTGDRTTGIRTWWLSTLARLGAVQAKGGDGIRFSDGTQLDAKAPDDPRQKGPGSIVSGMRFEALCCLWDIPGETLRNGTAC